MFIRFPCFPMAWEFCTVPFRKLFAWKSFAPLFSVAPISKRRYKNVSSGWHEAILSGKQIKNKLDKSYTFKSYPHVTWIINSNTPVTGFKGLPPKLPSRKSDTTLTTDLGFDNTTHDQFHLLDTDVMIFSGTPLLQSFAIKRVSFMPYWDSPNHPMEVDNSVASWIEPLRLKVIIII